MTPNFTAGASRAISRASLLARIMDATEIDATHLLWGLLQEESRAAEILTSHGVQDADLKQSFTIPDIDLGNDLPGTEGDLPPNVLVAEVLNEARQQATTLGRHVELGSEHLLGGLATVASQVRDFLHSHGVHAEQVAGLAVRQAGDSVSPISESIRLALPVGRPSDASDAHRIVDAAANRAREGLRVLEDYVRFTLNDQHLMSLLKNWRHEFSQALRVVDSRSLLASRDTEGDVGSTVHTRHERARESILDVVRASCKRVQEALRSLEEYGKVISPELGDKLGTLRYPLYTLERALLMTQSSRVRLAGHDLYLLVTEVLCPRGSGPLIRAALEGGVSIVQVREKEMPDRKLLEHAQRVREWTHAAGALFIMNDRPDLALLSEADGVHVGQEELSVREARRILGPGKLVGVSTHTIEQARQAVLDGADYIGVGPVFPTTTKSFDQFAGLDFVRQVAAEISLPAFAIGGIGPKNILEVVAAGARRAAVSSSLCGAENPEGVARELRSALANS